MTRRILLVTRRFWPLGAPEEAHLLELSSAWRAAGARVTIVTPQWDRSWPTQLVIREMKVVRLPYSPKRLWGGYWFLRRLNHWLRRNANQFDMLVVWRLQLDALLTTRVGEDLHLPVTVLYEGSGAGGDADWIRQSRYGQRVLDACKKASAVLAFDKASCEEALRLAIDPERCHLCEGVYPIAEAPTASRGSARIHLLESNRDFFTTAVTPVGLTVSTLEDRKAMTQLFSAWSLLRKDHLDARLWWIGDGAKRSSLYAMLGDHDLRYHAVLPGDFDNLDDLMTAADFYIAITPIAAKSVRRAIANGLPVFAVDSPEIRGMIPADAPVRYFCAGVADDLARCLRQACDAPEETRRWGAQSRDWAKAFAPVNKIAAGHLAIFDQIMSRLAEKSPGK